MWKHSVNKITGILRLLSVSSEEFRHGVCLQRLQAESGTRQRDTYDVT